MKEKGKEERREVEKRERGRKRKRRRKRGGEERYEREAAVRPSLQKGDKERESTGEDAGDLLASAEDSGGCE